MGTNNTVMRHDYDLPLDWESMNDEERSKWMTQERCRRQSMNQDTTTSKAMKKQENKHIRKISARPNTVSLSEYR